VLVENIQLMCRVIKAVSVIDRTSLNRLFILICYYMFLLRI